MGNSVVLYRQLSKQRGGNKMEAKKLTKLTFTGYAEKRFFIKENAISNNEISSETLGSIVLIEPAHINHNWIANGYVYSVEEM